MMKTPHFRASRPIRFTIGFHVTQKINTVPIETIREISDKVGIGRQCIGQQAWCGPCRED
jgi:hypothetical protein